MTDTVNVPREPTLAMVEAAGNAPFSKARRETTNVYDRRVETVRDMLRAGIAAAPKAEPVNETSVVPCPQCEGEGECADGLDEAACSTTCARCKGNGWLVDLTTQPEAPKAEQEPFGHWVAHTVGEPVFIRNGSYVPKGENYTVTSLYTRPAPASGELLEALEVVQSALSYAGQDACSEAVAQANKNQAYHIVSAIIAKHKGPQS